jgi:hypothetical protein
MQKFDYRAPRFVVDFPVQLKMLDSLHNARCRDISEDGMRIEIRTPFSPDCCGEVAFSYKGFSFELQVQVAHVGIAYDGVKFIYESEDQRTEILQLLSRLATPPRASRPFLIGGNRTGLSATDG